MAATSTKGPIQVEKPAGVGAGAVWAFGETASSSWRTSAGAWRRELVPRRRAGGGGNRRWPVADGVDAGQLAGGIGGELAAWVEE